MKETFGQRFQRLRKQHNLTQEEVAAKVNISAQAVSKWENDLSAPDISTLPLLADLFHISLDELLGRDVIKTEVIPVEKRKDINSLLLKIYVDTEDNDKVRINLPVSIIAACLESGVALPSINGKDVLNQIDFEQIFSLVQQGVIGELVVVETEDCTVRITVE